MFGFYGRILKIDLGSRKQRIEPVEDAILEKYLGGKGLGSYLLADLNPEGADPMGPDNHLIFATGPVAGGPVWGSCRYGVYTKSPLTHLYAESYSGGKTPEAVDAAGFDAIVLGGISDSPTILSITPDGVQFHNADDIWGMETYAAEDAINARFGKSDPGFRKKGAVVIGPAGENLVRFAVIENDYWRSAGRTGVGTVMGAKKVKGILFQGDCSRKLFDEPKASADYKTLAKESRDNPGVKAYKRMGTPMMVKIMNNAGAFPTQYWSKGICDHWEKISADALHEQCDVKPKACLKCFMACGRMTTIKNGRHKGLKIEGPEYETLYAFGGLCMIDSIEEIAFLNDICDRLGMDTITAGNLCAFAMEASKRGKIKDTIEYGDADAVADLLHRIAAKQGIGKILAEGIRTAAREWSLEEIAVHVKGMEPPGYDPRVLKGMGLGYATSDRGACHLRATFYKPELSGMIAPDQIEGKAELFIDFEDRLVLFDTLVLCRFYRDLYPWEVLGDLIHKTTGLKGDKASLKKIAADVLTLIREFNLREGMTIEDETLSKGLFRKMEKTGLTITESEMEAMLKDYFKIRNWDQSL